MFYLKLLCMQSPTGQKNTVKLSVFSSFLGSAHVKAACKMLVNQPLVSISSTFFDQLLLPQIPKAQKRQSSQQCCLALLGPTGVESCAYNVDEIDRWAPH
jgi:hypothetical protein